MSNDANSVDNSIPTEKKMVRDRQPKRLPISLWIALALFAFVPIARSLFFETDHQFANIAGAACIFLGGVASFVAVWRLFADTWTRRWVLLTTPLVLALMGFFLFEFVGMTGETLPVFRPRFWGSRGANQELGKDSASAIPTPTADAISAIASTQFLGSDRNGIVQEDRFEVAWNERLPKLLWKVPIGAGWSSFSVCDGLAITCEQIDRLESLTAFDLWTGEVVWRLAIPGRHYHPMGGLGPRSTPTIHQGKVFAQTAFGMVYCVNLKTGEMDWQQDLLKLAGITQEVAEGAVTWGRSGSPLVFDNQVVVPFGGKNGDRALRSLISFDSETGVELWRAGEQQISYSSPSRLTLSGVSQIVSLNEGTVTGHSEIDGHVLWSAPWPSSSSGEACSSQPVMVDDRKLLLGRGYALGSKLIDVVYSGSSGSELDPASWRVETVWESNKTLKTKFTSAIPLNGLLYGLSDGVLECVDPKDGSRVWRGGRYGHGQSIIVNEHLLITTEDGRIVIVPATEASGGKAIAEMPVLEGITWNVPVVAGPYLLVRNAEFAACLLSEKDNGQDAGSKSQ